MYGNTVLHIACERNNYDLVQLLLQSDFGQNSYSRSISNYLGQTPCQCTCSPNIRSLFVTSPSMMNHSISINNILTLYPNNQFPNPTTVPLNDTEVDWLRMYDNATDALDARFLMSITRSSWMVKTLLRFLMEKQAVDIVASLIKRYITDEDEYEEAMEAFKDYTNTKNPEHLLRIYSMDTPLYNALRKENNAFTTLLYMRLDGLKQRNFPKGDLYRGLTKENPDEYQKILQIYQKAMQSKSHIIETCALHSTSLCREVAESFADNINATSYAIFFHFKFPNECPTAINLRGISKFDEEDEILLLPFTLFKIIDIKEDSPKYHIISLENVPVPPATFNIIRRHIQI
ncbi:unnamed protein product [Adineta steineri]|uniref:NAD(+)--protein-arginine ADP-ribosyltransferase n=1 Tax=Adineta steineri TaxID=433720 RepID=A0A815W1Y8_9BILA|nr:unnamed protein product [Adineta steineri]CAF1656250.1 unnamed protein product [Adineta steineri]